MAIRPVDSYGSQVLIAAGYPYGKAKNQSDPGDNTGTPLEQAWVSDWFGFQQGLLDAANITPSGNPDKVGACQLLDAILALSPLRFGGSVTLTNALTINGVSPQSINFAVQTQFSDIVAFVNPVTFSDTVALDGATTFSAQATFDGGAQFNGAIVFGTPPTDSTTFTCFNTAFFGNTTTLDAGATINDDVDLNGDLDAGGTIQFTGSGKLVRSTQSFTGDQDVEINPNDANIFYTTDSNSQLRELKINGAGVEGQSILLYYDNDSGFSFNLVDENDAQIIHNGSQAQLSVRDTVLLTRINSKWVVEKAGQ